MVNQNTYTYLVTQHHKEQLARLRLVKENMQGSRMVIHLSQDADYHLGTYCIKLLFNQLLWLLNCFAVIVVMLKARPAIWMPSSFYPAVYLVYGLVMAVLFIYSVHMQYYNFRCFYDYLCATQRIRIETTLKEKAILLINKIIFTLKESKKEAMLTLISIALIVIIYSNIHTGTWLNVLFGTFCYGAMIADHLLLSEVVYYRDLEFWIYQEALNI